MPTAKKIPKNLIKICQKYSFVFILTIYYAIIKIKNQTK